MKFDKSAPRYQGGSIKLPDEAGEITTMYSGANFLEIFTETSSYKVKSPESIDPEETNPNAPWVISKSSDFGSSNKIVARVLLQSEEMMMSVVFKEHVANKDEVMQLIYDCKEALLICEKINSRVKKASDDIVKKITDTGLCVESGGRHINSFPQITDLDEEATNFLINIKRAIVKVCYLVEKFLPINRKDNNLEHLIKTISKLSNGECINFLEFLDGYKDSVKHLIELRNYQEHPGDKVTHIENYKLMPDGTICHPLWYVSGKEPSSLVVEMGSAIDFVISLNETMLMHLIFLSLDSNLPYYVEETPDDKINQKKPIKYKLSIDVSQLNFGK